MTYVSGLHDETGDEGTNDLVKEVVLRVADEELESIDWNDVVFGLGAGGFALVGGDEVNDGL